MHGQMYHDEKVYAVKHVLCIGAYLLLASRSSSLLSYVAILMLLTRLSSLSVQAE